MSDGVPTSSGKESCRSGRILIGDGCPMAGGAVTFGTVPEGALCSIVDPASCFPPMPKIPFKNPNLELCVGADSDGAGVDMAVDTRGNDTQGVRQRRMGIVLMSLHPDLLMLGEYAVGFSLLSGFKSFALVCALSWRRFWGRRVPRDRGARNVASTGRNVQGGAGDLQVDTTLRYKLL